ncbi:MAG: zinc-ribbon domain-containing protein [Lachnospiraceae bacterium]|nr:zinc-ribbon domain-containing protein [Lachnospiraceae bacterium]
MGVNNLYCSNCGSQVEDNVKFCSNCGKAIGKKNDDEIDKNESSIKINNSIETHKEDIKEQIEIVQSRILIVEAIWVFVSIYLVWDGVILSFGSDLNFYIEHIYNSFFIVILDLCEAIIGVINIIGSVKSILSYKRMTTDQIIKKYGKYIKIKYIYNIVICVALFVWDPLHVKTILLPLSTIGVAIFEMLFVTKYIRKNKEKLLSQT